MSRRLVIDQQSPGSESLVAELAVKLKHIVSVRCWLAVYLDVTVGVIIPHVPPVSGVVPEVLVALSANKI